MRELLDAARGPLKNPSSDNEVCLADLSYDKSSVTWEHME